jgi:hypothetical protein
VAGTQHFPLHCGEPTGSDVAASGADGVLATLRSPGSDGSIGYVPNSSALWSDLPVVRVQNAAGYFVPPTLYNVAVGLADGDGTTADPRSYPISYPEVAIVPTSPSDARMTTAKRQSLVDLLSYGVCTGQTEAGPYGYGFLPASLVEQALTQIAKVAAGDGGVDLTGLDPGTCRTPDLDEVAPMPEACQAPGAGPCGTSGPPTTTRAPSIGGVVRVGATVAADAGDWNADAVGYRWLADGESITGATGPTYRVPATLLGRSLSIRVTGVSADFPTRTATSATKRVDRGRLYGRRVTIAGRSVVGRTLAVRGAGIGGATIRVQWYAAGDKIAGAHSLRWTLRRAQLGKRITVRVVASAAAYETLTRMSPRTRVVRRP